MNVKQQTIKPTNIPITILKFYDKMIEIMFSAVDSMSSINSIFNICLMVMQQTYKESLHLRGLSEKFVDTYD